MNGILEVMKSVTCLFYHQTSCGGNMLFSYNFVCFWLFVAPIHFLIQHLGTGFSRLLKAQEVA